MTARFKDHVLAAGLLSARPAANTVPPGTLYPATDTSIVYRSDGTAWATWATLGSYSDEQARDAIGAALVAGANVTITVDDAGDHITIASTGGGGSSTASGCRLRTTGTTQQVANTTFTAVTWPAEDFDTDAYHDTSTNTDRITIPSGKDGKFLLSATVFLSYVSGGQTGTERIIEIRKNGTGVARAEAYTPGAHACHVSTGLISAIAGDYFQVFVYQDSGGIWSVDTAAYSTFSLSRAGS